MLGRTLRRIALDPYPQPFEYSKFPLYFQLLCLSQGFPLLASSQPFYLSPAHRPDFPHSPRFPHSWHTLLPATALPLLKPFPQLLFHSHPSSSASFSLLPPNFRLFPSCPFISPYFSSTFPLLSPHVLALHAWVQCIPLHLWLPDKI